MYTFKYIVTVNYRDIRGWGKGTVLLLVSCILCITLSLGKYNHDYYYYYYIFEMSQTLRLREEHLNHTLERQKVLMEWGLLIRGMNFPPLQLPMIFWTFFWVSSKFTFLVCWKLAISFTPTISNWSEITMYFTGKSSLVSVPLHLPSGRNLTLGLLEAGHQLQYHHI